MVTLIVFRAESAGPPSSFHVKFRPSIEVQFQKHDMFNHVLQVWKNGIQHNTVVAVSNEITALRLLVSKRQSFFRRQTTD